MKLVKVTKEVIGNDKRRYDYAFSFSDYIDGWRQVVYVNLTKDFNVTMESVSWEKEDNKAVELTSTLYRDFPLGDAYDRIIQWISVNGFEDTGVDTKNVFEYAENVIKIIDALDPKKGWRDDENWMLYASIYHQEFLKKSTQPIHQRVARRLKITPTNSAKVLQRGIAKGYFVSFGQGRSVVLSPQLIKKLKEYSVHNNK